MKTIRYNQDSSGKIQRLWIGETEIEHCEIGDAFQTYEETFAGAHVADLPMNLCIQVRIPFDENNLYKIRRIEDGHTTVIVDIQRVIDLSRWSCKLGWDDYAETLKKIADRVAPRLFEKSEVTGKQDRGRFTLEVVGSFDAESTDNILGRIHKAEDLIFVALDNLISRIPDLIADAAAQLDIQVL